MATDKELYEEARSLFLFASSEETMRQALEAFQRIPEYPGAAAYIEKCTKLIEWKVGAIAEFGTWKGQPIQWRVLESFDKERLLWAETLVGPVQYTNERRITYWENSDLRRWLNGTFARECFSLAEQTNIIISPLHNEPNPVICSQNGNDTNDKFYVFSHQEIEARGFTQEELTKDQLYWVRNPGTTLKAAEVVYKDGILYYLGVNNEDTSIMVRPVVKIRL